MLSAGAVRGARFIDVDPRKIGAHTPDGQVFGADHLPGPGTSFVLSAVGTRGARELISKALTEKGYCEETSFLCIA